MGCEIGEIGRFHLADAANGDRHLRIGRCAELIEKVDIGDLPEKLVFGADRAAASGGRDLQMKVSEHIAIRPRGLSLYEQCRGLQLVGRGGKAGDRRPRYPENQVRTQVRDEILPHPGQRGKTGAIERKLCETGALDRTQCNDGDAAGREFDEAAARIHARDATRTRGRWRGAQRQRMRIRQDHEFLAGVVAIRVRGRRTRGFHQQRHGAELVERKETGMWRSGLDRQGRFELEQIQKVGRRETCRRAETEQLRGVGARLKQRRRWKRGQRYRRADAPEIVE